MVTGAYYESGLQLQVEVKLQVLIHLLYFRPSGLNSKVLFMVIGAYNESVLCQRKPVYNLSMSTGRNQSTAPHHLRGSTPVVLFISHKIFSW